MEVAAKKNEQNKATKDEEQNRFKIRKFEKT